MKKIFIVMLVSLNSFGHGVIDSLYEGRPVYPNRNPASNEASFCLQTLDGKVFGGTCYSSRELCEKRRAFWQDLPGVKQQSCVKI